MSTLKLHTFNPMDHGFRVRWLLAELGKTAEPVHHEFEQVKSKDFAPLNPFHRIPVMEIEDEVLYESTAICWYLAQQYQSDLLLSPSDSRYAKMLQWLFMASSNFDSAAMSFAIANRMHAENTVIEEKSADLKSFLAPLEQHFTNNQWLLGDTFTLPDIIIAYSLGLVSAFGALNDYPAIRRFLSDFTQRPAASFTEVLGMWNY